MGSRLQKPIVTSAVEANVADDNKLRTISELAEIAGAEQIEGRTVVLCHGVFDLLHMGHVRHLQQAKSRGDVLIVTITADAFVNKGPGKPAFSEHLRAEMLSALSCVDWVGVNNAPDATRVLDAVKPAVYAKGADYVDAGADVTGKIQPGTPNYRGEWRPDRLYRRHHVQFHGTAESPFRCIRASHSRFPGSDAGKWRPRADSIDDRQGRKLGESCWSATRSSTSTDTSRRWASHPKKT